MRSKSICSAREQAGYPVYAGSATQKRIKYLPCRSGLITEQTAAKFSPIFLISGDSDFRITSIIGLPSKKLFTMSLGIGN